MLKSVFSFYLSKPDGLQQTHHLPSLTLIR